MNYYNESTQTLITEVIDRTDALDYSINEFNTWAGKHLENKPTLQATYISSVKDKANKLDSMLATLMSVSICNKATGDLIKKTFQEAYTAVEAAKAFVKAVDKDPN
jgi:hypothetical protein